MKRPEHREVMEALVTRAREHYASLPYARENARGRATESHDVMVLGSRPTRVLWLALDPTSLKSWRRVRETLTLLNTLAWIDALAFRIELDVVWAARRTCLDDRTSGGAWQTVDDSYPLLLGIVLGSTNLATSTSTMAMAFDSHIVSPSLRRLYRRIHSLMEEPAKVAIIPMHVHFDSTSPNEYTQREHLKYTLQLTTSQLLVQRQPALIGGADAASMLHLPLVRSLHLNAGGIDFAALQYLRQLLTFGVLIRDVSWLAVDENATHDCQVVQSLRALLGSGGKHDGTTVSCAHTVSFADSSPAKATAAVMSLAHASPYIRKLRLVYHRSYDRLSDTERHDRSVLAKWIVYALYDKSRRNRIQSLEIDVRELVDNDIDVMLDTLTSSAQEDMLSNVLDSTPRPSHLRRLRAQTFMLVEPKDPNIDLKTFYRPDLPIVVEAIGKGSDTPWWKVILPGAGIAWVHETDMSAEPYSQNNKPTKITSIRLLDLTSRSKSATIKLLRLFSQSISSIELGRSLYSNPFDPSFDDWCRQLMVSCPKLKCLNTGIESVHDLRIFTSQEVGCLSKLVIDHKVNALACGLDILFEMLANSYHWLAKHLQELSLRLDIVPGSIERFLQPLCNLLERNRRLHTFTLHLHVHDDDPRKTELLEVLTQFRDAEPIVICSKPLGLRHKLAFLSTVNSQKSVPSAQGRGRLDDLVVATIFEFAAHSRARSIRLWY